MINLMILDSKGDIMEELKQSENTIALMALYRQEWEYRDANFYFLFWRFMYLSLIIVFLPNLVNHFGITGIHISKIPTWIFSIIGIACTFVGFYVTYNEEKRIEEIDKAYKKLLNELPKEYQVGSIIEEEKGKKIKFFSYRTNRVLCCTYIFVIVLAISNIFF